MAAGNYKSAEQMNAERRAKKLNQKHGGKKAKVVPGFSMNDLVGERRKREQFEDNIKRLASRGDKGLHKLNAYSVSGAVYKALYNYLKSNNEYSYVLNREEGWIMYWLRSDLRQMAA